jgi:hypothetical protein
VDDDVADFVGSRVSCLASGRPSENNGQMTATTARKITTRIAYAKPGPNGRR